MNTIYSLYARLYPKSKNPCIITNQTPKRASSQWTYTPESTYFVLDVNNVNNVYENAHLDKTPIPVYVLRLSKRKVGIFRKES
jgi:hypothetical protein